MEPEARYTLVGALVIALAAAAAFAFVWLQGAGVASDFRFYSIYFERQSLEGLQVGGDVNMRGIKVGRVEAYAIERRNINRVSVTVRVGRATPVSQNTEAVVERNLVTGIARINLVTPAEPGPPLDTAPENEVFPVIAEGTSDMQQIARTANSVVAAAEVALKRLNDVLTDENVAAFREALLDVRDLARSVNRRLDTVESAVVALRESARGIQETARSFQDTAGAISGAARAVQDETGHVGGAVVDIARRVEPVVGEAADALRETRTTLREMGGVLAELAKATRTLERDAGALVRRADDAADVGVLELRATAQQLRSGVEQLTRTLERLEDPRAALLGPGERKLGPGETLK